MVKSESDEIDGKRESRVMEKGEIQGSQLWRVEGNRGWWTIRVAKSSVRMTRVVKDGGSEGCGRWGGWNKR